MPDFPYIDNFSDSEIYVLSTLGKGPKGDKGDDGDVTFPTYADPIEWDPTTDYGAHTIVEHDGDIYVSKKLVPHGIVITNANYWQFLASVPTLSKLEICATGNRPSDATDGDVIFDSTLRKPLFRYDGEWLDANGTTA